jgi:glycosyltransferase involved in cell wall biosynthesis
MNIFWITKLSDSSPYKSTQFGMTNALRKNGHHVILYLVHHISKLNKSTKDVRFIPVIDTKFLSGFIFGLYLMFYFPVIIKKEKIDVVIVDGDQIFSLFVWVLRLMKITLIWDIRSLPIDRVKSMLHDISFTLTKIMVDDLTTISSELKDLLRKKYGIMNKKIGIWSSGVSLEIFQTQIDLKFNDNLKKENDFIVLYHGTYSPTRGVDELVESISFIDSSIQPFITLIIVGIDDKNKRHLVNLSEELHIQNNIKIISPVVQKKIPAYINLADVGVVPLPPENDWWRVSVPLKTLEYLVMAKPVIVTNIPFHNELFEQCQCGINISSNDPRHIAQAIMDMYKNKDQLEILGNRGKNYVRNRYSWDKVSSDLESFIQSVQVT